MLLAGFFLIVFLIHLVFQDHYFVLCAFLPLDVYARSDPVTDMYPVKMKIKLCCYALPANLAVLTLRALCAEYYFRRSDWLKALG